MMNAPIFYELINGYNASAYTHDYILGFRDRGNIYMAIVKADVLPYVCKLDKASRGAGYSLRFKPDKMQKEFLKTHGDCKIVCSEEYFDMVHDSLGYKNRGDAFEKLIAEMDGQEWIKSNEPYTKAPDLVIDGVGYQLKFEKATFCSESSLANLTK